MVSAFQLVALSQMAITIWFAATADSTHLRHFRH
jgi:hypothetical protein